MSGFENYPAEVKALEQEIERMGIALGIDWSDEVQVRILAREAISAEHDGTMTAASHGDRPALARAELFGLAALMLKTMEESAHEGFLTHGGPVWKIFGRALWAEYETRRRT